mgnify:CR=1 FL=1
MYVLVSFWAFGGWEHAQINILKREKRGKFEMAAFQFREQVYQNFSDNEDCCMAT